jgi:hypothetical protein
MTQRNDAGAFHLMCRETLELYLPATLFVGQRTLLADKLQQGGFQFGREGVAYPGPQSQNLGMGEV